MLDDYYGDRYDDSMDGFEAKKLGGSGWWLLCILIATAIIALVIGGYWYAEKKGHDLSQSPGAATAVIPLR